MDQFNCRFKRQKFQMIFKTFDRRRLRSVAAKIDGKNRALPLYVRIFAFISPIYIQKI